LYHYDHFGIVVSLCLWDPVALIGGINHYLLTFKVGNNIASPRFGTVAIETLVEDIRSLGGSESRLRAKLFGGARIIDAFREKEEHIGIINVRIAIEILHTRGIPVVEQDVAGRRARKLTFNTDDGVSLDQISLNRRKEGDMCLLNQAECESENA
jgi:chemotaxis protein CheD